MHRGDGRATTEATSPCRTGCTAARMVRRESTCQRYGARRQKKAQDHHGILPRSLLLHETTVPRFLPSASLPLVARQAPRTRGRRIHGTSTKPGTAGTVACLFVVVVYGLFFRNRTSTPAASSGASPPPRPTDGRGVEATRFWARRES